VIATHLSNIVLHNNRDWQHKQMHAVFTNSMPMLSWLHSAVWNFAVFRRFVSRSVHQQNNEKKQMQLIS